MIPAHTSTFTEAALHLRRTRRREALDELILAYSVRRRERDAQLLEQWRRYLAELP